MGAALRILNQGRDKLLVSEGWGALGFWARLRGLLCRPRLLPGQGLWITSCNWIHTVGMRFAVDVLYLDREGRVLRLASDMHPNCFGPLVWRARSVVELPAGTIESTGTTVGDQLAITWVHEGGRE